MNWDGLLVLNSIVYWFGIENSNFQRIENVESIVSCFGKTGKTVKSSKMTFSVHFVTKKYFLVLTFFFHNWLWIFLVFMETLLTGFVMAPVFYKWERSDKKHIEVKKKKKKHWNGFNLFSRLDCEIHILLSNSYNCI